MFNLKLFVIAQHEAGYCDEYLLLPICDGCGRPILDFEKANVIYDHGPLKDPVQKPVDTGLTLSRVPLLSLADVGISVFHWECDATPEDHFTGWTRLSNVLREDQRTDFDRICAGEPRREVHT